MQYMVKLLLTQTGSKNEHLKLLGKLNMDRTSAMKKLFLLFIAVATPTSWLHK